MTKIAQLLRVTTPETMPQLERSLSSGRAADGSYAGCRFSIRPPSWYCCRVAPPLVPIRGPINDRDNPAVRADRAGSTRCFPGRSTQRGRAQNSHRASVKLVGRV